MNSTDLQHKTFLLVLITVSIAFGWLLLPFFGAVFWATVLAIIFRPFYRWLLAALHQRQNLAALVTLLLSLILVILPLALMAVALLQDAIALYQRIRSGEMNFGVYFQQIMSALPPWMVNLLESAGITSIVELTDMLSNAALQASQYIAAGALAIGQNALDFIVSFLIMLYLLFYLLRDGSVLSAKITQAIPLSMEHKRYLFKKFTTVVRATVKGTIAVAVAQGTLGGLIFAFLDIQGALLWGFMMGLLSLVPAGAALIWTPVAIYFLVTGAIWQGITLVIFGILVIGLVDNLLRPLLVGKDTQIPDYIILITTLGGLVFFGAIGFIIGPVIAALFIAAWDLLSSTRETPKGIDGTQ